MKISLKWLSDYVDVPSDLQAFCDRLDLTGTGVEGVEQAGASFEKIVTAQVLSKTAHPDSDHLWVCSVDVGSWNTNDEGKPEPLQIVCGAQNFKEGDHIVTALIGATLPGDFTIKKAKMRGVASCGMNCSSRELGLSDDHEGILILPADAPVGVPFAEYAGLGDTILDLEITPNRPDCLSVVGLAREVGAMYRTDVRMPSYELEEARNKPNVSELATVEIEDPSRCRRYTTRIIKNVKIGPSPAWLAERVAACGARPINNVVDATNYILFLYGQPLHAFDYDKLLSADSMAHIVVRAAKEGEEFQTLDGEMRTLTSDMTVIATPERAVALAGVMGGLETEITDSTTNVLLEAATFDPGRTSRTSRSLGLISESSMRYERRVDDHPIANYADAAAALIAQVAGGVVCPGIIDVYPAPSIVAPLEFRTERFRAMMGADIPRADIVDILTRLGCEVNAPAHADTIHVVPPSFRPDLEREIDLYEEVLRLWGMDRVTPTLPKGSGRVGALTDAQKLGRVVNRVMTSAGLNETTTYAFSDPQDIQRLTFNEEALGLGKAVKLLNPMSSEQSVMRQSILPGLLRSVAYNQAHGVKNVQLYETGVVFSAREGAQKPKEKKKLAAVLAGSMGDAAWNSTPAAFDFFDGKGIIENLARELAIPKLRFKAPENGELSHLQPGRAALVFSGGSLLGWLGEIHPVALKDFEADGPVVAFELDLTALGNASQEHREAKDLPAFPPVEADLAFVVDESVTHERMVQAITSAGGKLLEDVRLFDVFRDADRLGANKKSMAYALTFRAPDRTLTSEEVDSTISKLIGKVAGATGAEVRS